ncbi:hypothetical protein Nepgr_027502 [Nepenthes gracilis]|uniref:Protein kinase domain-containing protein n=1 Tax=Nepenthes gracilis TaxID=150966 RepID=A0AAD3TAG4_NEPGR|nr:hypothetical protein Nepgr_027502 [Nepenthes gracilis]
MIGETGVSKAWIFSCWKMDLKIEAFLLVICIQIMISLASTDSGDHFGLSKSFSDIDKGYVTTQVKGTLGYLDPEYYLTQQLTEKSDVYSFGVVMLELVTGRIPLQQGKYIVREVKTAIDKTKDLYNLHELIDRAIRSDAIPLVGFEKFVDLALSCVEESAAKRPSMSDLVKEIENIIRLAGLNPNIDSTPVSSAYDSSSKENIRSFYGYDSLDSGSTSSLIDPINRI